MCWRCYPGPGNPDAREIDILIEAQVRDHLARRGLSRRGILQLGAGILALPATSWLQGCATVPVSGRSQLMLLSPQEEAKLGVEAFAQLRQKESDRGRLLTEHQDPPAHAQVRRVSDRVIEASGLKDRYRWEYMIVDAPKTVNAAAIAGGRIIVYTGILPVAQDDAGLATILGHEVGHVMAHHTGERYSQNVLASVAGVAAGIAGASAGVPGDLTMAVFGLGTQVGILLPYSRKHESEADYIGLILMAKAGYDPRESVGLWQRMSQSGGGRPPEFLSTHPNPETRIKDLESWMPQAWKYYENPQLPLPNIG
jgi:metalloendopeptidase OMA1, mitochondrial